MKKIFLIFLALIVLAGIVNTINKPNPKNNIKTVSINHQIFQVELAQTPAEREKGLMGRDHLDDNAGMLFIFDQTTIQTFWMKNTKIPLDIIWINDGKIVEITTLNPATTDNIPQYTPKNKANYVLELNAGLTIKNGFKVGDEVKIKY